MLYSSPQWIADIDTVLQTLPELSRLAGHSVMVTGAAGLVCSPVVDILFRYNDTHDQKIQILAAGRWPEEMEGRFGAMTRREDFTFVRYDASRPDCRIEAAADYIIHGASNAFPALIVKEPVETMLANFTGLKVLLDHSRQTGAKRLLYISSSEVYGEKEDSAPFREGQYGYIDLLNPRSSYSVGKRAAETLCASYAAEYGLECVIVRPGHIYGPTASPQDNRVASAWAWQAARGGDIVMKSDGSQLRSYCYCLDCASAILRVLLCGQSVSAYNISNPSSVITIRQMAEILRDTAGVALRTELPDETERRGFNPMSNSSLDSAGLLGLGWQGCFDAPAGFAHTVQILREQLP